VIPAPVRLRENQRRSRERRKELIEDLQQRLQNHERQQVQATVSVQLAAKRVMHENALLRALLRQKGTSDQEITDCIRNNQNAAEFPLYSLNVLNSEPKSNLSVIPVDRALSKRSATKIDYIEQSHAQQEYLKDQYLGYVHEGHGQGRSWYVNTPQLDPSLGTVSQTSPKHGKPIHFGPINSIKDPSTIPHLQQQGDLFHVSRCNNLDVPDHETAVETPILEMSCERAAGIIAGMRGNGDEELAKFELGCCGERLCKVDNMKVLEVMQMETE
jgi:hypothetical protein